MTALANYLSNTNRIHSKSFTLNKVKCTDLRFLRAYLFQALNSNFSFVEEIENNHILLEKSINDLTLEDMIIIFDDAQIPNFYFYYLSDKLNDFNSEQYESFPKLFTNVIEVSFDNGGLVVLECFFNQIYELYTANGKFIEGPCHDLNLLTDGKYLSRSLNPSRGGFELNQFQANLQQVKSIAKFGDFDLPTETLQLIYNRDQIYIPLLDDKVTIENSRIENFQTPTNIAEANKIINDLETNWICSPELACYYWNDKALAIEAINKDKLAYTLLSNELKMDIDVAIVLIYNEDNGIPYVKEELLNNQLIIEAILEQKSKASFSDENQDDDNLPF